jgi:moderate conductance mechanosensitive channel
VIGVIAVLMILNLFGIDIGPAIAGLGVVGIAVGFGAQTLMRDWLAGIFIVLENQYSQGDVVRIAGVDGVVEDFSLRRTTLRDLDGTVHTVPNGQITVASNMTRLWARVNLDVGVAYDTDIDARHRADRPGRRGAAGRSRVGAAAARGAEGDARQRARRLGGDAQGARAGPRRASSGRSAGELRKRILAAFAREGVEIPFPHQVIVTPIAIGAGEPATADPWTRLTSVNHADSRSRRMPARRRAEGQADSSSALNRHSLAGRGARA